MAKTVQYENILRAIGQNLEYIDAESFDLNASDDTFLASGQYKKTNATPSPDPTSTKSFLGFIKTFGRKKPTQTPEPQPSYFSDLRFSQSDIELLDRKGKVLRSDLDRRMLDPHSISQVLRTAGAYLDHKQSRLLKLSWRQQILTLWHVNRVGVEAREVFTSPDLYSLWVHQFKQRVKPTGTD